MTTRSGKSRLRRNRWGGIRRRLAAITVGTVGGVAVMTGVALRPAAAAGAYDPATDITSMAALTRQTGVTTWWNAGYTGAGVDVALVDSGVAPVAGLDGPDKIVYGPDLSLESQSIELQNLDTFGHGTFMAGLIAGHDTSLAAPYADAPKTSYRGVAPDARIVSLKVATADGGADVTQMIAAIDWVVQHRFDNGMNIRVISLSYGTNSTQKYDVDPLAYAVEQAWKKGIVVVAAAGNTGYQRGHGAPGLANPAYNPFVIGVGGYDNNGTAVFSDDTMGSYSASSAGCKSCKNPDFVAVGSHLQGLRVPGSYIDVTHPEGRLDDRYFRGSGTSEAAAVTTGAIALVLQKYPTLTPDEVKRFIMDSAKKIGGADTQAQGAGEINLTAMATKVPPKYSQKFPASNGTGTIEAARGSDRLTRDGVVLTGEMDVFGMPVDTSTLAQVEATSSSWSGGSWNGSRWSSSSWSGSSWTSSSWSSSSWSGSSWASSSWSSSSWSGSSWTSSSWSSSSWSGSSWTGGSWSTAEWA